MLAFRVYRASAGAVLLLSSLLSSTLAWPTYNLHNGDVAKHLHSGHMGKRQFDNPPGGGEDDDPTFNEEYDFIVAGGKPQFCATSWTTSPKMTRC